MVYRINAPSIKHLFDYGVSSLFGTS